MALQLFKNAVAWDQDELKVGDVYVYYSSSLESNQIIVFDIILQNSHKKCCILQNSFIRANKHWQVYSSRIYYLQLNLPLVTKHKVNS